MDNTQLGITEYVGDSSRSEIPCLIKLLYSDFIVVEIAEDGSVLKPESADQNVIKEEEEESVKEQNQEIDEEQKQEADETSGEPALKRPKLFSESDMESIESVANGRTESHTIQTENVDKEERKVVHEYIRKRYHNSLVTNGRQNAILVTKANSKNADDRQRRDAWPKQRGDYLHFVLTKMNKDHFFALSLLAKFSGLKSHNFSVAGTKDRRAITSQLACAYRVTKEKLLAVAPRLRDVWISNLSYSKQKLQLGCLAGNRFSIVLREIGDITDEELTKRIDDWKNLGFLNYFGHQRFGSFGTSTAEIGRLILSSKWEEAVKMILKPRNDTRDSSLVNCLNKFDETGDADLALQQLRGAQKYGSIESIMLNSLKRKKDAYKDAIMALFRDSRSLYVHAYQSLVFNKILSRRFQKHGLQVLAGDVLLNNCANEDGVKVEPKEIHEVALPLPSLNPTLPANEVGQWYEEVLSADGLSSESFKNLEQSFAVSGAMRSMVIKPASVEWEVLSYTDPRAELQSSSFATGLKEVWTKVDVSGAGKDDSVKANGSDAGDSVVKAEVKDEISIDGANELTDNKAEVGGPEPTATGEATAVEKKYRALKVQFDLPSSCYATVALRELLRTDFGKKAQKSKQ